LDQHLTEDVALPADDAEIGRLGNEPVRELDFAPEGFVASASTRPPVVVPHEC
jgi:hypothetical protein